MVGYGTNATTTNGGTTHNNTVAEREAELVALQSAFDEYIASSRELEEELDAELAKMQEKLAESTAANAALSSQLENISPQLSSLEVALSNARQKLKEEQSLRRMAEQAQDDADQKIRTLEQTITSLREECDDVHEELAFKESELEETRLELEVEKQQLQNELLNVRQALAMAEAANQTHSGSSTIDLTMSSDENGTAVIRKTNTDRAVIMMNDHNTQAVETSTILSYDNDDENNNSSDANTIAKPMNSVAPPSTTAEGYAKHLEDELELVTEQLIETEKLLSATQEDLLRKENQFRIMHEQLTNYEAQERQYHQLQTDHDEIVTEHSRLKDELASAHEELALCKEEIQLQTEAITALEQDYQTTMKTLEEERKQHQSIVDDLHVQIRELEISTKASVNEASLIAVAVQEANQQNELMMEQVAALENALENAKSDYQKCLEELDLVNARFDEARVEAEKAGRDGAMEEMRNVMRADAEHEIRTVKENLEHLSMENKLLQQKVDDAEIKLAAAFGKGSNHNDDEIENKGDDATNRSGGTTSHMDALIQELQKQLQSAKDDAMKKDTEIVTFTSEMTTRLQKAEDMVVHLEGELHAAKGQLAEAEAHLIVLRKEKERHDLVIPESPTRKTTTINLNKKLDSTDESNDTETMRGRSLTDMNSLEPPHTPIDAKRPRSSSPSSVMRLELRLAEEVKKNNHLEKEYNELLDQKRMSEVRIKRLEEDIKILQKQLFSTNAGTSDALSAVTTQMSRLSSLGSTDRGMDLISNEEIAGKRLEHIIDSRDVKLLTEELRAMEKKCNSQREYNAQLLSKMLHLQGNIQVYCRIRPMTVQEIQSGSRSVVEPLSETEVGCFDQRTNKWKSFAFDRVWGPDQSQTSVFQDVEPLALSVVDGFNACIFAYGQTGSGKTYTMEGTQETNQFGISYRTIQKIFHLLNLRAQQQRAASMFVGNDEVKEEVEFSFKLKVGMLEIYNDEIYDLLATSGATVQEKKEEAMRAGGKSSLEIRRDKDGRVEVPNLTKEAVTNINEVMNLLKRGNSNRATAATDMNEHSSRSHMVLSVDVESGLGQSSMNKGTLYLVDLAGSERVRKSNVEGENLKEAGFINKSLAALGNVMEALDRRATHVPFRDSKLTSLLQNALGGNSRTMMVVTTCPVDKFYDESVHALQFATRVRRIQIGAAQRNVSSKNLEETVKALTAEMLALTRAKERTEGQLLSLKRDNDRVQDKLQNIANARSQGRADSKTLDILKKSNDEMAARWEKEKIAREEASDELEKSRKELRVTQQQLNRFKSKLEQLEQKLEDKELALERASEELRSERNRKSAATVRSRRDDVLNSRVLRPATTTPSSIIQSPSLSTIPVPSPSRGIVRKSPTSQQAVGGESSSESSKDVTAIRTQVLKLLEKYDKAKVDRVDIIMEKFKGKEVLLLEKMTQRYEASSSGTATSTITQQQHAAALATRNELALQRHQERMKRIHEKRAAALQQPNKSS